MFKWINFFIDKMSAFVDSREGKVILDYDNLEIKGPTTFDNAIIQFGSLNVVGSIQAGGNITTTGQLGGNTLLTGAGHITGLLLVDGDITSGGVISATGTFPSFSHADAGVYLGKDTPTAGADAGVDVVSSGDGYINFSNLSSSSPIAAIEVNGTAQNLTIAMTGTTAINIAPNGKTTFNMYVINIAGSQTPAASSSPGTMGDICYDSGFIYVCTATNTWARVPIATW
jgi:hypothetical protein